MFQVAWQIFAKAIGSRLKTMNDSYIMLKSISMLGNAAGGEYVGSVPVPEQGVPHFGSLKCLGFSPVFRKCEDVGGKAFRSTLLKQFTGFRAQTFCSWFWMTEAPPEALRTGASSIPQTGRWLRAASCSRVLS